MDILIALVIGAGIGALCTILLGIREGNSYKRTADR